MFLYNWLELSFVPWTLFLRSCDFNIIVLFQLTRETSIFISLFILLFDLVWVRFLDTFSMIESHLKNKLVHH